MGFIEDIADPLITDANTNVTNGTCFIEELDEESDSCSSEAVEEYDEALHIGAIFITLAVSFIGGLVKYKNLLFVISGIYLWEFIYCI